MLVWRGLKALGITRKEKTKYASEQDCSDVQKARGPFREEEDAEAAARRVPIRVTGRKAQ